MKIISIEGLDKSGKHTLSEKLLKALREKGYRVEKSEFHRYDTPTGELIMKWLTKEWDVDQLTIELVMAADKQAQQKWFDELEKSGIDILVLDRYTGSQDAYAEANGVNWEWVMSLQTHMRQPDIELFIDIPADVSLSRKGKHNGGENDRYESDIALLDKVRDLFWARNNRVIDGMRTPDEIADEAIDILIHEGIIK